MPRFRVSTAILLLPFFSSLIKGQPSPDQQKRIAAAIKAAANQTNPDYTAFVNPFIGTGGYPCLTFERDIHYSDRRQLRRCMVR